MSILPVLTHMAALRKEALTLTEVNLASATRAVNRSALEDFDVWHDDAQESDERVAKWLTTLQTRRASVGWGAIARLCYGE
ncbi:MAG: hypothetical protein F4058_04840 [Rhodothermaceae bacterium]|nr:hypothetical protein [Rhodothermaceae bacterium]MYF62882.1 hypothetical protein [Rhodothermaceae bacterium]MYI84647.1 hypothetical protein [Rhodothermaceae bacterium]